MFSFARSKIFWTASLAFAVSTQSAWGQQGLKYAPKPMGGMPMQQGIHQPQQNYQNPTTSPQQPQQQQLSGTIEAIGSHGMQIDALGSKWNVAPDKGCKIEVTGTSDASLLKPGMLVRFSADIDKKTGKASAPVTEIDVTSPQNAMAADHPRNQPAAAGAHTALKKTSPAAASSGPTTVVGTLKAVSGNEITVDCPSGSIKADLSPSASVKIDSSDPKLAQVGAKVEVQGFAVKQSNVIAAQSIRITLAGSGEKNPGAKPGEKPAAAAN